MGLSRYLIQAASQFYLGNRAEWTYPDLYLGLFTTLPTGPDDAGVELVDASYSRWLTVCSVYFSDWERRTDPTHVWDRVTNATRLTGGPFVANHTLVGVGLWDAASGGNLLCYARLTTGVLTVLAGQRVTFLESLVATSLGAITWDGSFMAGGSATHAYVFRYCGLGPPSGYRPANYRIYPLVAGMTHAWWMADYYAMPAGYITVANNATEFPLVGGEVTNGSDWTFPARAADGPDYTHLLIVAYYGPAYNPLCQARMQSGVTVHAGQQLVVPAGSLRIVEW